MANYIDPLANSELLRALAFARARETYPGLNGELLLEICEAAWERAAGDPTDGHALNRFERALDLIARQYRVGGGRLTVAEVADQAIPASALSRYVRSDRPAGEAADPVPIAPAHTFGRRLPRLAPAPLGAALAGAVFGVAAAAQAGVMPDMPIVPGSHSSDNTADSSGSGDAAGGVTDGSGAAPIANSQRQPGFLASASAAKKGMDNQDWLSRVTGGQGDAPRAPLASAAPQLTGPSGVSLPDAAPVSTGSQGAASAPVTAPAVSRPDAPTGGAPAGPAVDLDVGGVNVQVGSDDAPAEKPDQQHTGDDWDKGQGEPAKAPEPSNGVSVTLPDGQQVAGVYVDQDGNGTPEIRLPWGQTIPVGVPGVTTGDDPTAGDDVGSGEDAGDSDDPSASLEGSEGNEDAGDGTGEESPAPDPTEDTGEAGSDSPVAEAAKAASTVPTTAQQLLARKAQADQAAQAQPAAQPAPAAQPQPAPVAQPQPQPAQTTAAPAPTDTQPAVPAQQPATGQPATPPAPTG